MSFSYANMSGIRHMSAIRPPFSNWLITSDFCLVLIVFCQFFSWIALGDGDLRFSFW